MSAAATTINARSLLLLRMQRQLTEIQAVDGQDHQVLNDSTENPVLHSIVKKIAVIALIAKISVIVVIAMIAVRNRK